MEPTDDDRARGARLEAALATLLYDGSARARLRAGDVDDDLLATLEPNALDEAAAAVRRMVLARPHRGGGDLRSWFPKTLAAWLAVHPDDVALERLALRFCAWTPCRQWRESGDLGIALEEALYRFFEDERIGDAAVREAELLAAIVRGLAVTPLASFNWPAAVQPAPGGCYAVTRDLTLHAAIDGRYLCGTVTPIVAELLRGESEEAVAARFSVTLRELVTVKGALRTMRLVP